MTPQVNYAVDVLCSYMQKRNRLAYGLQQRQKLRDALLAGKDVSSDPRYQFIVESAGLVTDFLRDIAAQFDKLYPNDQCSTLDIHDILVVVQSKFGLNKKE